MWQLLARADIFSAWKTGGMRLSSALLLNLRGQVVCFGKKKERHGLDKRGDLLMDDLRRKTWTVSGRAYCSAAETRNELPWTSVSASRGVPPSTSRQVTRAKRYCDLEHMRLPGHQKYTKGVLI